MAILNRRLETVWEKASFKDRLTSQTEARVLLDNLVHYTSRSSIENDIVTVAATLLWFKQQPSAEPASNVMSEEQMAKLARRISGIAMQFNEGAVMDNEMLAAIITQLAEAGVKW